MFLPCGCSEARGRLQRRHCPSAQSCALPGSLPASKWWSQALSFIGWRCPRLSLLGCGGDRRGRDSKAMSGHPGSHHPACTCAGIGHPSSHQPDPFPVLGPGGATQGSRKWPRTVPALPGSVSLCSHPFPSWAWCPPPCVPVPAFPGSASRSPHPHPCPTEQLVPPSTFTVHTWAVKRFGTRSRHRCAAPSLVRSRLESHFWGQLSHRGGGSVTADLHPGHRPRRMFTFTLSFGYFPSGAAQLRSLLQM